MEKISEHESLFSREGEGIEVAEGMADVIGRGELIHSGHIPDIVGRMAGNVNVYPSMVKGDCKKKAYFISLKDKRYAKGNGHLTFRQALECLVQHMQGACYDITGIAILLSDIWDAGAYDDWHNNIKQIKRQGKIVEAYIIGGNKVTRMQI